MSDTSTLKGTRFPKLTEKQKASLLHVWRYTLKGRERTPDAAFWESYGIGDYSTDKHVPLPTAKALEKQGLARVRVHDSYHWVTVAPFRDTRYGHKKVRVIDHSVKLTPEGEAFAAALTAPRRNPSSNDPGLTVAKLKLRRIAPGHYEHVNKATGTTWEIFHRTREYRGENEWVYFRTDVEWGTSTWSEGRAHDTFFTKADAVEALVDYLQERDGR